MISYRFYTYKIIAMDIRYITDTAYAMSGETCAKWRNTREPMRENMDSDIFFQKYTLSEETSMKIESIRKTINDNIAQAHPMWRVLTGESEEVFTENEDSDNDDDDDEPNKNNSQTHNQSILQPSTQFYFTQVERTIEPEKSVVISQHYVSQKCDILESLCECLEKNNGKLDFVQLENLNDENLVSLIDELAKKLSSKGIYNVCQSMNDMTIEQGMKYLSTLCTHLLLPKIIELEESSRLLSSAIGECVKKFPDEVLQFIFVPLLDVELKDTKLITTIVNSFDEQKKTILLEKFLVFVKELKSWHISILQNLLSVRLDHDTTDKITKLFSRKALYYSKDKNFGKLIFSFLKINTTLSEEQKNLMIEIAAINETLYKRPIENILRNI